MIFGLLAVATVSVGQMEMKTYPFSDPDPVPAVTTVKYPYFRYDGSSATSVQKSWQTVTLENEAIRVTIFPEIGGKVWGAVDKKTGKDFIYFNHVVKFRDIAMRGPWCSGGIEYNFGIIGHAPSCSTPVDWFTRQNPDGSVSCFIASAEYITRAWWQVEVRLAPGAENFETHTTWYNASGLEQPYYHWMNAAFSTRGNPQFLFPGAAYIGHDGDAHAWPRDAAGHVLDVFEGNAFGGPKSYHVLPGANGVYGIWWPDNKVGAVHRSESYEKYGRKIWLWALSREGGIWEDLLTDDDGQYTELQSGRCFNQPRRNNFKTPFKHPSFAPGATETFIEKWGVIRDAQALTAEAKAAETLVERPREAPVDFDWSTPWGHVVRARQHLLERGDAAAEAEFRQALAADRFLSPAMTGLAAIELRRGRYAEVHAFCRRALAIDAYDAEANYLDGRAYFLEGNTVTARDRLGLASFQPQFRAAALALVARSFLREGKPAEATVAADKALAANAQEFDALLAKIIAARGTPQAATFAQAMLARFPLFHAARYELGLAGGTDDYRTYIRNELPDQTYLELGEWYADSGLAADAQGFFAEAKGNPIAHIRLAYLLHTRGNTAAAQQALAAARQLPVAGVFPFRAGTLMALDWAAQAQQHWKFDYYRGLLLAFFNLSEEATKALDRCDVADEAVPFLARASLRTGAARLADLRRAQKLGDSWRVGRALATHYAEVEDWAAFLRVTTDYITRFPACNPLQIAHGKALLKNGRYAACLDYLRGVKLLPSEHRDSGTEIWQAAEKALNPACEVTWPENLGKGKPYPDSPSLLPRTE